MKTISLWKISSLKKSKMKLDDLYLHKNTKEELHIACIYNLPSYRSGIIGWLISFFCDYLPKTYVISNIFKSLRFKSDADIVSQSVSYVNRLVPILNFGTWNRKQHFLNYNRTNSIFKYGGENNKSLSGMFSFCEPFFDSGCAIFSNVPSYKTDFIKYNTFSNEGILWSYFNDHEILIITFKSSKSMSIYDELDSIINIQKKLASEFVCKNTYIIGDFKKEIIFDSKLNQIVDGFYVNKLDTITNSYMIHDYIYEPSIDGNVVKINTPIKSPPPNDIIVEKIEMSPIKEDKEEKDVEKKEESSVKQGEEKKGEETPSIFPYIIFNYFSNKSPTTTQKNTPTTTQKNTPIITPSHSPPSHSPPLQSPKSDDGWSKV